jgi:ribosomal protein L11 methylase PrmA
MHAICMELLEHHLQPGARVLDVGAGESLFREGGLEGGEVYILFREGG